VVRGELEDGVGKGRSRQLVSPHAGCPHTFRRQLAENGLEAVIGDLACTRVVTREPN
jgi:hypothetical protein